MSVPFCRNVLILAFTLMDRWTSPPMHANTTWIKKPWKTHTKPTKINSKTPVVHNAALWLMRELMQIIAVLMQDIMHRHPLDMIPASLFFIAGEGLFFRNHAYTVRINEKCKTALETFQNACKSLPKITSKSFQRSSKMLAKDIPVPKN